MKACWKVSEEPTKGLCSKRGSSPCIFLGSCIPMITPDDYISLVFMQYIA